MPTIQYRALTEPVSQDAEALHVDAFWRQPSEQVARRERRSVAALSPSYFEPVSQDAEAEHLDAFWRQPSEPKRLVRRVRVGWVGFIEAEPVILPDGWWREAGRPRWAERRSVALGGFFDVVPQAGEDITQDKWWRQPSEPRRYRPRRLAALVSGSLEPASQLGTSVTRLAARLNRGTSEVSTLGRGSTEVTGRLGRGSASVSGIPRGTTEYLGEGS